MACAGRTWMVACVMAGSSLVGLVDPSPAQGPRGFRAPVARPDTVGGYSSNHIVVTFRPGVMDRARAMGAIRRPGGRAALATDLRPAVRRAFEKWRGTRVRPVYPFEFGNPKLAAQYGLDRTYVIDVPEGTDTRAMAAAFRQCGEDVENAGVSSIGSLAEFLPDDPDFWRQYALHNLGLISGTYDADIDAPEAWDLHTGNLGTVTIAIIDSGVSPHVEFGDRLLPGVNTNEPKRCYDGPNDGELCADDLDCPGGSCDWSDLTIDEYGHGTHVAGIAAAAGNNGIGIAGVTWGAHILPVRVTDAAGTSISTNAATALIWAADQGADICNLSLQYYGLGTPDANLLRNSVNYAHGQGALIIAAAGNYPLSGVAAPARFANCMAVGATDDSDSWAPFSSYGPELDVCAPGDRIYSTVPGDLYNHQNGTSMAAPHVAGLAALLKSHAYYYTNDQIRTVLTTTADDLGTPGWDQFYGYGRINAFAALSAVPKSLMIVSSAPENRSIDARQPFEPNGSNPDGWDLMAITFDDNAEGLVGEDFTISVDPAGTAPSFTVTAVGDTATLEFDSTIPVGAWTIIRHKDSNMTRRLGYLPGDVDADGECTSTDVDALLDALNEIGDPPAIWSTDADRSGRTTARDILRLIDLLNGAGEYDVFLGATLPD